MITESLKSIKNHLRLSKITKNQERWIENAKLIASTAIRFEGSYTQNHAWDPKRQH